MSPDGTGDAAGTAAGVPAGGAERRAPSPLRCVPSAGRTGGQGRNPGRARQEAPTATHALRQLTCAPRVGMG